MTRHIAGGYHDPIRHVRHEIRPRLYVPMGKEVEHPVHSETEPAENVYGDPLRPVNGVQMFERHTYYAHEHAVPTWITERIELDEDEPAVHEYGYYIIHTARFWSRILRADVLNLMDRYKKTDIVSEIEAADASATEVKREVSVSRFADYTPDMSQYPVKPQVRKNAS